MGCLPLNFSCFNGLFDELRVWSVARTPEEIMQHYTKALVGNEAGPRRLLEVRRRARLDDGRRLGDDRGHMAHAGVLMSATDAGAPTS